MSTILIGVDASARSEDAVAFGRRLATASGARVVVACAFPYEDVPNPATNSMYRDELRSGAELTAKRQAEGLRDVPEDRVEIRAVGRYSAAHVLHTIAGAEQASLVVVGSTHTGHLGRVMPGATAERLLHGSPCAVAVVPSGYRTQTDVPLRRIGVATDGSAESQAAVAAAAELACAAGARLDVISVVPSESYTAPALTGGPGYHTLRQDLEDRTRETLDDAMAALPAGTDADRVTLKGHPVHALIDHSTELDLLIVGSRGYGPLRSVIVGGVSGPVVRGAHCPVIALPRGVEAPLGEALHVLDDDGGVSAMSPPIVAAYDPFTEDRAPVDLAQAAAELTGAPVLVAAVAPEVLVQGLADPAPIHAEIAGLTQSALARVHADTGLETRMVSDASVPHALHALAAQEEARLLVVGSTARGHRGRAVPGSTGERLLAGSPCPVALAPHGYERRPVETVAVGFADTPEGHAALAAAHALARRAGARLRVITAVHPAGMLDAAFARGTPPLRGVKLEGHHRAEHEAAMARAVAALPAGVAVEQEMHVDDPADVLVHVSEHVEVIVCGSRGYGPVRGLLLGGVSRRVVDEAHCPVLVLPRGVDLLPEDLVGAAAAAAT